MEQKGLEESPTQSVAASVEAGLALSNNNRANGTHDCEISRLGIRDRGVVKDPRDSKRKDKLITSYCILIDIYKGKYEVRGKVNKKGA